MENRSRLPGEPSLDHPGVPTDRLGHRAGLKTVGGIPGRLFCGLPALPRKCSDPGVGASSTGKHRSPQTAPRLQGPNIGSNEPGRSPEVMLDPLFAWRKLARRKFRTTCHPWLHRGVTYQLERQANLQHPAGCATRPAYGRYGQEPIGYDGRADR